MNDSHSLAFVVRTKGFEDERIVLRNDDKQFTIPKDIIEYNKSFQLTDQQKLNILFNNAIAIALHPERKGQISYILLFGTKIVATVQSNKLYWTIDKPKYLSLLQRRL